MYTIQPKAHTTKIIRAGLATLRQLLTILAMCMAITNSNAQTQKADTSTMTVEELNKKRQDPVSGLRSVFLQDILIPMGEGNANSFSIQPVFPFRISQNLKLITYTIIPFEKIPPLYPGGQSESGLGNILFNGYFAAAEKKGNISWGAGPAIQIPTRTNAALGSNRVCMGPSALFYYSGTKFSGGTVVQNYWSLGGEGINEVNLFSLQYIAFYNFNKGWFLLSNATVESDWLAKNGQQWLVPVGGGGGKTFQIGKNYFCADAQVFYNAVKPDIIGNWQAIVQFQMIL